MALALLSRRQRAGQNGAAGAGPAPLSFRDNPVWQAFRRSSGAVAMVFVASLWMNILGLVPPLFMLQVYDRVLTSMSEATLLLMLGVSLFLIVIFGLLDNLRNRLLVRIGVRIDADLHENLFEAVFRRNLRRPDASGARVLQEIGIVRNFVSGPALIALFDVPWTPLYLLLCWAIDPLLATIALVSAALSLTLTALAELVTRPPLEEANRQSMAANMLSDASLRNSEVIEAMGMLPSLMRRWTDRYRRTILFQARASDRAAILNAAGKIIQQASYIVTLGVGALLVIDDKISPGLMIITSMIVARTLLPINQLVGSWKSVVAARGAAQRLGMLLTEHNAQPEQQMSLPPPEGAVFVDRIIVSRASGGPPILKGLSFDVPRGTLVGIIGPSGSGKTTLARAILGIVPLAQGVVRLDGADITTLSRSELGPSIGYLPQDVELFGGSVAENIARFGPLLADDVVEAAKVAGVHELVLSLPAGYDTQIGEQGGVLSAGQRQRIALARAIYGGPKLIVLDEPNSNLDADGEQALHRALLTLKERGATVLVIAHRSSILANLDRLLAMRDGVMEAYGTTGDMMPKLTRPVAAGARNQ